METHLSPRQVAEALQVSESSVKRWCDSGVIPTVKTVGGHRRIPREGLMLFLQATNRRMLDPAAVGFDPEDWQMDSEQGLSDTRESVFQREKQLREDFYAALIRGDEAECRRILLFCYQSRFSMATIADGLLTETMRRVGDEWCNETIEIYQERRGCEICSRLIQELRRLVPEPASDGPLAIGATPSGDLYSLPGQLIEVVLREAGWRACNLGNNVPFGSLQEAVRTLNPRLVWLSVSHIEDEEAFVQECVAFEESLSREVALVVGGRALSDRIRPRLKFTAHCDTLQQLTNLATSIRGVRPNWRVSEN